VTRLAIVRTGQSQKHGNHIVVVDGEKFHSMGEYRRWCELQLEQRAGRITDLERQVAYELVPTLRRPGQRTEPALRYTVDYRYREDGTVVCEEYKGHPDAAWKIRRRLFIWLYPDITLRVTGGGRR
jgi:hypothetical protein